MPRIAIAAIGYLLLIDISTAFAQIGPDNCIRPVLIIGVLGVILLFAGFLMPRIRYEGLPLWGIGLIFIGVACGISIYVFPSEYFWNEMAPFIPKVIIGLVGSVIAGLIVRVILRR